MSAFRYLLKTEGVEWECTKRPVPKFEDDGNGGRSTRQKIDKATGYPVWTIEVTAFTNEEDGSAVFPVSVASSAMPDVAWRQPVEVVDLEIFPWASKDRRSGDVRQGVAFKAREVRPAGGHLSALSAA